jgi:uncharacterized protein YjhX (UPF0386 family)
MIKHIVLFKVNDKSKIEEAKKLILNLKNEIKEIIDIEVFSDIGYDKTASDFGLITTLKTKKDLDIYAKHPKHLEVIDFIKTIAVERRAIDYEI